MAARGTRHKKAFKSRKIPTAEPERAPADSAMNGGGIPAQARITALAEGLGRLRAFCDRGLGLARLRLRGLLRRCAFGRRLRLMDCS